MRPVDKGLNNTIFTRYQEAQQPLVNVLGEYCSYCERRLETDLAIEHVYPKGVPATAHLICDWNNFILSCKNCNSTKGNTPIDDINRINYLWPHLDNTLRAFSYQNGLVQINSIWVGTPLEAVIQNTIQLIGLDKDPGNPIPRRRPTKKDKRWERRHEIWQKAETQRHRLNQEDTIFLRETIVENALGWGCFSIWYTVFVYDQDMRQRLVDAFIGTDISSFDNSSMPIARANGQI